jgi:hypothetical protein
MSNYENLMYAAQGLTPPCCEHYHGGEDASLPLTEDEQNEIINQRVNHPIFPKTTRTKIEKLSAEFFGDVKELPYLIEGKDNYLTVVQKRINDLN